MTMTMNLEPKGPGIWSHGLELEERIDRLSDLPDYILERILSLAALDSKILVQTSIVSKRWRCLWKGVPALNFSRASFKAEWSFTDHVLMYLSLRCHSIAVGSIAFNFGSIICERARCMEMFDHVMQYATAAHGGQLRHLSISCAGGKVRLSPVVASITRCPVYESLKVLKLKGFCLDTAALSSVGFKLLTTLELHHCRLSDYPTVHPLANLPACLNYLKLNGCTAQCWFRISSPQLLVLEIRSSPFSGGVEVFAPKLKSFSLWCSMEDIKYIRQLNFPSLAHANIRLWGQDRHDWKDRTVLECFSCAYINLLRGLHHVESLILRFDKSESGIPWGDRQLPFSRMKPLTKSWKASPFPRLKLLRVLYPRELSKLPLEVFRYFFRSSSINTEEMTVKFEWQSE
ncbi:unnamed protein product [Linum tenue]|uniref:F-box domain-containing protein n=1 Tax=Linum tenue TaxID=586396 RepID=A0AAV0M7Y3_9ROSI|nr:unnamed protein product [Linum tenue]